MENTLKTFGVLILSLLLLLAPAALALNGPPWINLSVGGHVHESTGGTVTVHAWDFTNPGYPAIFVVGLSQWNHPYGDYTMIPYPDLVVGFVTGYPAPGDTYFTATFDPGIPQGTDIYLQAWQHAQQDGYDPIWQGSNGQTIHVDP